MENTADLLPSEFRVTNYVSDTRNNLLQITKIVNEHNEKSIEAWRLDKPHLGASNDSLRRIELTEALIKILGFKKFGYGYTDPDKYIWVNFEHDLPIIYKYRHGNKEFPMICYCEFLHELQNVYHALTGHNAFIKRRNASVKKLINIDESITV